MRAIIAGGSGLIGRELAECMSSDGHEAIILSRSLEPHEGLLDPNRTVQWDARTSHNWRQLVDQTTAIVNLAGANVGEGR